jgi:hypothetical protein
MGLCVLILRSQCLNSALVCQRRLRPPRAALCLALQALHRRYVCDVCATPLPFLCATLVAVLLQPLIRSIADAHNRLLLWRWIGQDRRRRECQGEQARRKEGKRRRLDLQLLYRGPEPLRLALCCPLGTQTQPVLCYFTDRSTRRATPRAACAWLLAQRLPSPSKKDGRALAARNSTPPPSTAPFSLLLFVFVR